MPIPLQFELRNHLLRTMEADDFALLSPHLERRSARKGAVLFQPDTPVEHAWFLESGLGSIISILPDGARVESGLFGRDGFAPVALVMGSDRSAFQCIVQMDDDCFRLPAEALAQAIGQSVRLRDLLLRFAHALSTQTAYTAISNAVHPIDERLARWLLMSHDRSDGDELALTHEFLAIMLAVRRPSVTTSLHVLEGKGFIRSERGCVIVRDRAALEAFAGAAYGPAEAEYERLLGSWRQPQSHSLV